MNPSIESIDNGELHQKLKAEMSQVLEPQDLEGLRRNWLSKKGYIKILFGSIAQLAVSERAKVAANLNLMKNELEIFLQSKEEEFNSRELNTQLKSHFFDLSYPAKFSGLGRIHPVTEIERKIMSILAPLGFKEVFGPEIETEYYCFDSLNIPKHHPARDMQDTFYTNTGEVLRTHTTSVQARVLEQGGLPIKVASFGRVYRNETEDASHTSMFHQFELIWLEKNLTFSHLMGLVEYILKSLYGKESEIRFVPKFYPYTEPSVGAQIACSLCNGVGCSFCGSAGWSTIAGAGMIHRNVLSEFKYNPAEVSGIAFGLGTSRLAAQDFQLPNGKILYENDLRIYRNLR